LAKDEVDGDVLDEDAAAAAGDTWAVE